MRYGRVITAMRYKSPDKCEGWVDIEGEGGYTYPGPNLTPCNVNAKWWRYEKDRVLRLCVLCTAEYDFAHT